MTYQSDIAGWHDFYLTCGSASAALVGLLFVGLSLHIRVVVTNPDVRSLARVTLTNFVDVLLVSLFLVSPSQSSSAAGLELIIVCVVSLGLIIRPAVDGVRQRKTLTLRVLISRFAFSALGYAAIAAGGVLLLEGAYDSALQAMLATVIGLLVIAVRNTWDLLVTVSDRSAA